MATTRKTTTGRAPAMWVLIAVFLLPGCGYGVAKRTIERLVLQPVCPVCKAVRIEDCHCFRGREDAGYCETQWVSPNPTFGMEAHERREMPVMEEMPLEELPEPTPAAVPEAEAIPASPAGPHAGASDVSGETGLITETVVRQAAAVQRRSRNRQAVQRHFADRVAPPADRE